MKAWTLHATYNLHNDIAPLQLIEMPPPLPGAHEIQLRVECCGVCHTELDEIEGRTPPPKYPVIPGHQVIGTVALAGEACRRFKIGDRVGVAWIANACGRCEHCMAGYENLCDDFVATGRDMNGGYAEFMTVDENFAYAIPTIFSSIHAAPLLCAGAIGYRSLRLANLKDGDTLALSGFGASGHLVLKTAKFLYPGSKIFVFARSAEEQQFARMLGCDWAGDYSSSPPALANAVIDTTPAWRPVIRSLAILKPGGRLVINAIRKESADKEELIHLDYGHHLWMEKEIKSVANITRKDVEDFLEIAGRLQIKPDVETYSFEKANDALIDLKRKHINGAKVLVVYSV